MELVAVAVAVAVGSLLKGITGMGLPPIAIPVLALVVGAQEAIVIIALPTAATNAWLVWRHRDQWSATRNLPALLVGSAIAAPAGAWLLTELDERVIALALAALVVAYVVARLTRPELAIPPTAARRTAAPVGLAGGLLQGATGLSGPLLATYLHAYRLPQGAFVLSITSLFLISAVGQAAGLAWLGRFDGQALLAGATASVLALLVLPLGARVAPKLSTRLFDRAVLGVLALSAVGLLREAFLT